MEANRRNGGYVVDNTRGQDMPVYMKNKYAVTGKQGGVWFPVDLPKDMSKTEALFFAAYIVASCDKNGEQFQEILRQVRRL